MKDQECGHFVGKIPRHSDNEIFVAPYALDSSNQLRKILLPARSLLPSKSISNLTSLTKLSGLSAVINHALYQLPQLHTISEFRFQDKRTITRINDKINIDLTFTFERSFILKAPNLRVIESAEFEQTEVRMTNLELGIGGGY